MLKLYFASTLPNLRLSQTALHSCRQLPQLRTPRTPYPTPGPPRVTTYDPYGYNMVHYGRDRRNNFCTTSKLVDAGDRCPRLTSAQAKGPPSKL